MSQGYTLDQICDQLTRTRFRWTSEKDLQKGIGQVFQEMGLPFSREHRLGPKDIPDFLIDGSLCLEVKIKGSVNDLLRQVKRYANYSEVVALVVVTGRMQHRGLPATINGKPLRVVSLTGSIFA